MTVDEVIKEACGLIETNHHIPQFVRGDICAKIKDLAHAKKEAPLPPPEPKEEPEFEAEPESEAEE